MTRCMALLLAGLISVTGYTDRGIAADGTEAGPGVAACPQAFAFGTVLAVEGVGTVVCHDRTPGNPWSVDVWVPTIQEAYALTCRAAWGCQRAYEVVEWPA